MADENKTQESSNVSPKRLPLAEEGIMETLLLPFSPRFIVLTICAVVTALLIGIGIADRKIFDILLIPILIFGALTLLGVRDLMQKGHAVLRNYPISAHIRFLLEELKLMFEGRDFVEGSGNKPGHFVIEKAFVER